MCEEIGGGVKVPDNDPQGGNQGFFDCCQLRDGRPLSLECRCDTPTWMGRGHTKRSAATRHYPTGPR